MHEIGRSVNLRNIARLYLLFSNSEPQAKRGAGGGGVLVNDAA